MSQTFLLIDFENVRVVPLASLPAEYHILIFVGRSQNSIPFEITREAQQLGSRLEWIKIEGDGRNNLDFHLAYYLGLLAAKHGKAEFLVLSRDKGFDPVIRHAVGTGLHCSRIESLGKIVDAPPSLNDPHFEKAFKVLSGTAKNSRPRKQKTLTALVASLFQNKQPAEEIQRIVEVLFTKKLISEANNTLAYNF
jgi:hypothetical protein